MPIVYCIVYRGDVGMLRQGRVRVQRLDCCGDRSGSVPPCPSLFAEESRSKTGCKMWKGVSKDLKDTVVVVVSNRMSKIFNIYRCPFCCLVELNQYINKNMGIVSMKVRMSILTLNNPRILNRLWWVMSSLVLLMFCSRQELSHKVTNSWTVDMCHLPASAEAEWRVF